MGGRSRKSQLKQKLAKYYKDRENPLAALALYDEIVKLNQPKFVQLQKNLEYLRELEEKGEPTGIKLSIRKIHSEEDKKFATRAFYEALYPITLEYRFMPLQAIFAWYLRALELVYGDKPPKIHLNRLQKWINYWLGSLDEEQELRLKSGIISWIMNRYT